MFAISRKEVARLAGVSEATVSRVLNNVGPIKPETRDKVLQAASEVGYVPSALAQQFARKKSDNVGVILPFVPKVQLFSTFYFSQILSGIGEAAQKHGYNLLLIFRDPAGNRNYSHLFRAQKIDACIMLGSSDSEEERIALAELEREKFPFCLVNQQYSEENYNTVDADHVTGSYEAVKHLITGGHQRIAFINGPIQFSNSNDRFRGYRQALIDAKLPVDNELVFSGNYSRTSGLQLAPELARRIKDNQISAIFAANDRMAIGVMNGLVPFGLVAGRDYGLVGYDNSDGAKIVTPSLSTVTVPFYEMGQQAMEILVADLNKKTAQQQRMTANKVLLPVAFIKRETS
ncbi:LacI family DNA-binding transcriptional regulator [Paenibacillus yanchengensis]|uniref:LacI family DNA-binding transcriptional regulator n=1 Tax=Paenibacillus yanchengensis TaxID=2035833 RepID=A0ABW4YR31_9BACL